MRERRALLTPQRTDARRNREMILRAADEAFAEGADSVQIEEIALSLIHISEPTRPY